MLQIDLTSRVPIYEQIYTNIIRLASAGVLKPGDKILPVRSLAAQLGINPNTVAKAYRQLESEGYIISNVGRGSYVSDKLTGDCAEKEIALDDFRQSVNRANLLSIKKSELIEIINNVYDGGGIND
ncbi:GntR family transcriptional regulator [Eubacterium sp. OM08-24]|jgi:GntR family transcriptional regulator|uniref:GntR family transcriptional regulator n=1 Tax=Eubacterium sp. OM08-24 TaxID=2292352 RepID=UPI000E44953A|nr:GntR family transcriptional regulator [Eubacterium sp. OM08-24]RGM19534.1 GntR family transcriptional regulator [Eubacterium sp. OM08-24]